MIWSSNLAYAVGLLVTDGNLSKDGRHIIMRSSDIDLLKAFNISLNMDLAMRQTHNNGHAIKPSYRIQFSNVKLYRWLLAIGIFPAKTYSLGKIKVPDKFFRDFLRGHLDGDGNIMFYIDKYNFYKNRNYINNRLSVRFISASQIHVEWLRQKVTQLTSLKGALFSDTNKKGVPIWTLKFSKSDSLSILKWIYYENNLPCLERKRRLAFEAINLISQERRRTWTRIPTE